MHYNAVTLTQLTRPPGKQAFDNYNNTNHKILNNAADYLIKLNWKLKVLPAILLLNIL